MPWFAVQTDWFGSLAQKENEMATYGLAPAGRVNWTGYSNTLGNGAANQDATSGYVAFNGICQGDFYINQPMGLGGQVRAINQLLYTLLGAATGATATMTKKQVQHVTGAPGGAVPIETITLINRATTANDLTAFQALVQRSNGPASYPADLSGNGGGGKQTYASGSAY